MQTQRSFARLVGAVTLALAAGGTQAAQVCLNGAYAFGPTGSSGPLGQNDSISTYFAAGDSYDNRVEGVMVATNETASDGSWNRLSLTLESFRFSSTSSKPLTLIITAVQDFTLSGGGTLSGIDQRIAGFGAGQNTDGCVTVVMANYNNGQALPGLSWDCAQKPTTSGYFSTSSRTNLLDGAASGIYRMVTTLSMTLSAGTNGSVELGLGDTGETAQFQMVPLPASAWAGLAGLSGLGLVSHARRRRLRSAD
jgi:hypothetical protein